jgi:hypothetical protein
LRGNRSFRLLAVVMAGLFLAQVVGPSENAAGQEPYSAHPVWGTLGGDSARNGSCPYDLERNRGEIEWTSSGHSAGAGYLSPVIGPNGMIYAAADYTLMCISPEGLDIWMIRTGFGINVPNFQNWVSASPSIGPNGSIYVGGGDVNLLTPWASLYAITPKGAIEWNLSCEDLVLCSPAISSSGMIFFGTSEKISTGPHFLHAVAPNGTSMWKLDVGPMRMLSSPAISPNGDIVLVTWNSSDPKASRLTAVSQQGQIRWSHTLDAICESTPTISNSGDIFLGANDGIFYAFKSDGTLNWTFSSGERINGGAAIGPQGLLIFASLDINSSSVMNGHVHALSSNGELKWEQPSAVKNYCYPLISRDGVVIIGNSAFNLDGSLRWRLEQDIGSAAAAKDGTLYAGADGSVVAIFVERSAIGLVVVASTTVALLTMALIIHRSEKKNKKE